MVGVKKLRLYRQTQMYGNKKKGNIYLMHSFAFTFKSLRSAGKREMRSYEEHRLQTQSVLYILTDTRNRWYLLLEEVTG